MESATRAKLIGAVEKVFHRGGHAKSLRELARLAGVTTGAVYSQFEDRSDLFVAAALERSPLLAALRQGASLDLGTALRRGDLLLDAVVLVRSEPRRSKTLREGIKDAVGGDEDRLATLTVLLGAAALASVGVAVDQERLLSRLSPTSERRRR